MFKRMSVLVRRDGDERTNFSEKWKAHAAPVSMLPKIRGYIQNHIEEEILVPDKESPVKADGFVELYWDNPEDMVEAFKSPLARPMIDDEPGFLGHGSGYALASAPALKDSEGGKLILALVYKEPGSFFEDLEEERESLNVTHLIRDDVVRLIDKPDMSRSQPVNTFVHLYFGNKEEARTAGKKIAERFGNQENISVGIYRVYTVRFV